MSRPQGTGNTDQGTRPETLPRVPVSVSILLQTLSLTLSQEARGSEFALPAFGERTGEPALPVCPFAHLPGGLVLEGRP